MRDFLPCDSSLALLGRAAYRRFAIPMKAVCGQLLQTSKYTAANVCQGAKSDKMMCRNQQAQRYERMAELTMQAQSHYQRLRPCTAQLQATRSQL